MKAAPRTPIVFSLILLLVAALVTPRIETMAADAPAPSSAAAVKAATPTPDLLLAARRSLLAGAPRAAINHARQARHGKLDQADKAKAARIMCVAHAALGQRQAAVEYCRKSSRVARHWQLYTVPARIAAIRRGYERYLQANSLANRRLTMD